MLSGKIFGQGFIYVYIRHTEAGMFPEAVGFFRKKILQLEAFNKDRQEVKNDWKVFDYFPFQNR